MMMVMVLMTRKTYRQNLHVVSRVDINPIIHYWSLSSHRINRIYPTNLICDGGKAAFKGCEYRLRENDATSQKKKEKRRIKEK